MNSAINLLQNIFASHERMLQLAQLLQWDEIAAEWNVAEKQLADLAKMHLNTLAGSDRAEAARLIEQILELQKKTVALIKPWQEQVQPLLESFKRYPLKKTIQETGSAG